VLVTQVRLKDIDVRSHNAVARIQTCTCIATSRTSLVRSMPQSERRLYRQIQCPVWPREAKSANWMHETEGRDHMRSPTDSEAVSVRDRDLVAMIAARQDTDEGRDCWGRDSGSLDWL
jgi:hypothetical protein